MRAATASTAALGVFVVIAVSEHLLVPDLSPRDHMLSEYANASGAAGPLMTLAFLALAAALGLASAAVVDGSRAGWVLCALLAIAAAGMFLTAVAPTQTVAGVLPPGVARSTTGRIHDLASGAVLLGFFPAAIAGLFRFPRARRLAIVTAAALVVTLTVVAVDLDANGVRQRVQVAGGCVWLLALLLEGRRAQRPAASTP
jgi:hypothetical protein